MVSSDACIAVYMLANRKHGTLYVGVTSQLFQRISQHRDGRFPGFTKKHGVKLLVWFELHGEMTAAIHREKQLKKYKREWKANLIEQTNPHWEDLYPILRGDDLFEGKPLSGFNQFD